MGTDQSEIYVLDKRIKLKQPEKGFRTSIDGVLLAAACPVKSRQTVLDMGCGVGTVIFCIAERVSSAVFTGVDINAAYIKLAEQNADLNKKDAVFIASDIRDFSPEDCFDHVVCNPPFLEAGQHVSSPDGDVATARGHQQNDLSLQDWIDAGYRNLKQGGSLSMIHRADMTDRIIHAMGTRFGAIEIIPLWPRKGVSAKRIIVRATKDRKSPAAIHPGLVLHEADGAYTAAAEDILRRLRPF